MKKKIIALLLFLVINSSIGYAEQIAAEEYRSMFHEGDFYLEFKDKWGTRIIAKKTVPEWNA